MPRITLPRPEKLSKSSSILATKALVITLATAVLFFQDLALIFGDALENAMLSYVLAIPFLFDDEIEEGFQLRVSVPLG